MTDLLPKFTFFGQHQAVETQVYPSSVHHPARGHHADGTQAKLFKNHASQAVRLPAEFRFEGDEVSISRDQTTQNVILSTQPEAQVWDEFFSFVRGVDIPKDPMKDRPSNRPMMDEEEPLFSEED